MHNRIDVLDFGGQYTQLIAKAIRSCHVYSEIRDCNLDIDNIQRDPPKGIVLSGGPNSVYEEGAPTINPSLLALGIPVLGLCYGMQLMNYVPGGGMLRGADIGGEYGQTAVYVKRNHPLFRGLDDRITAWMSHGDSVDGARLAEGFGVIAKTANHVAGIANDDKKLYGLQFHPEVTHTPSGLKIFSNFLDICGCTRDWTMANHIQVSREYIRQKVGSGNVVCFVSGGVDSCYVAALHASTEGIGRVIAVYVGALMRKHENEQVIQSLKAAGVKDLIYVEAEDRFIAAVAGMSDPEQKRKAIGNLFGQIQQEVCASLGLDPLNTFLAQGTLYTDLIESGKGVGKKAATIKSHHNVGCPFIEELQRAGRVVEPNRQLFKDEVRQAAREIGLPPEISERQPFPGPGLGIRIVDSRKEWIDESYHKMNTEVMRIAQEEKMKGYVLPVKTVGVQGDGRTYSYLALLRGERDWDRIRAAACRLPTEVRQINRVVYDISQEPISTDCLTGTISTQVTRETIDLLKDTDWEGRGIIDRYGFSPRISQTIFILFGADIYRTGKRSVALRAVSTDDFMTVAPIAPTGERMSWACLDEICTALLTKLKVGAFVIDVTDKPPATTCWE